MDRRMREAELYPAVKMWLEAAGYAVMAEIPCPYAGASLMDVVGWREGRYPVVVELKTSFTKMLGYQAHHGLIVTPFSYAAAPTKPRDGFLVRARRFGFGVLRVNSGVEVVQKPRIHTRNSMGGYYYHKKFQAECREYIAGGAAEEETIGGMPNMAGVGPAHTVAQRVNEYREINPQASWQELFERVPNHYANHNSMRGALRSRGLV